MQGKKNRNCVVGGYFRLVVHRSPLWRGEVWAETEWSEGANCKEVRGEAFQMERITLSMSLGGCMIDVVQGIAQRPVWLGCNQCRAAWPMGSHKVLQNAVVLTYLYHHDDVDWCFLWIFCVSGTLLSALSHFFLITIPEIKTVCVLRSEEICWLAQDRIPRKWWS